MNKEELENWEIHQSTCAFRKKKKWIVYPCDMNCKNVFDSIWHQEINRVLEEVEKKVEYEGGGIVGAELVLVDTVKSILSSYKIK